MGDAVFYRVTDRGTRAGYIYHRILNLLLLLLLLLLYPCDWHLFPAYKSAWMDQYILLKSPPGRQPSRNQWAFFESSLSVSLSFRPFVRSSVRSFVRSRGRRPAEYRISSGGRRLSCRVALLYSVRCTHSIWYIGTARSLRVRLDRMVQKRGGGGEVGRLERYWVG